MVIQLNVYSPGKDKKIVDLCDTEEQMKKITVEQLQRIIGKAFMTDDPLKLVYGTRTLEENKLLISYNIKHMTVIHSVLRLPGGI